MFFRPKKIILRKDQAFLGFILLAYVSARIGVIPFISFIGYLEQNLTPFIINVPYRTEAENIPRIQARQVDIPVS